jgi:hypothetical protein
VRLAGLSVGLKRVRSIKTLQHTVHTKVKGSRKKIAMEGECEIERKTRCDMLTVNNKEGGRN